MKEKELGKLYLSDVPCISLKPTRKKNEWENDKNGADMYMFIFLDENSMNV
jgi:hypothetical protein